jgi:hypothetical protein
MKIAEKVARPKMKRVCGIRMGETLGSVFPVSETVLLVADRVAVAAGFGTVPSNISWSVGSPQPPSGAITVAPPFILWNYH